MVKSLRFHLDEYGISYTHFSKRRASRFKFTDEEIFRKNSHACQSTVKERFLTLYPEKYKCKCTQGPTWMGRPLTLELEHKDGDRKNNELSNLEFLCPNCHGITPTYGSKNSRKFSKTPTISEIDLMVQEREDWEQEASFAPELLSKDLSRDFLVDQISSGASFESLVKLTGHNKKRLKGLSKFYNLAIPSAAQNKTSDLTRETFEQFFRQGLTWGAIGLRYGCSDVAAKKRALLLGADISLRPSHLNRPRK